jgi:hypothetical protein
MRRGALTLFFGESSFISHSYVEKTRFASGPEAATGPVKNSREGCPGGLIESPEKARLNPKGAPHTDMLQLQLSTVGASLASARSSEGA